MKICFIINSLECGGAEKVLSNLANYWARAHEVHIITFRSDKDLPFYSLLPSIHLHSLGSSQRFSKVGKLLRVIPSALKLRTRVKKISPTIIISFIDLMNIFSLIALKGLNIPHIISERIDPHDYQIGVFSEFLRNRLYPSATCLVVQTQHIAHYFSPKIKKRVIPNAVTVSSFQPSNLATSRRIIAIGRLQPQKGFDLLIKAFSRVVKSFPEWSVHIYGEGSSRSDLQNLIKHFNLSEKVKLHGVTSEIEDKLKEAGLFVFPSRFEGFPNALVEGMALGLPVLASEIQGVKDLIVHKRNGFLFPLEDVRKLEEGLRTLLKNESLRIDLGKEAQKIAQIYSPEIIYEQWDEILTPSKK